MMERRKFSKCLSGYELVQKGYTNLDTSLPEVGLKEVVPDGSWLEQKQIQAALDARKQIIGVERIVRNGGITHAEWRDDLKLAECGQRTGGHWKYFGQVIGKLWYLKPEEALLLMELNLLILHHNEVIVSLEKAYALLLDSEMSLTQYQVYASLNRVGYKVYRHKETIKNPRKRKSDDSAEPLAKAHKSSDKLEELNEMDELENDRNVFSNGNDDPMENIAENPVEGSSKNTSDDKNLTEIMEEGTDNTTAAKNVTKTMDECTDKSSDDINITITMEEGTNNTRTDKNIPKIMEIVTEHTSDDENMTKIIEEGTKNTITDKNKPKIMTIGTEHTSDGMNIPKIMEIGTENTSDQKNISKIMEIDTEHTSDGKNIPKIMEIGAENTSDDKNRSTIMEESTEHTSDDKNVINSREIQNEMEVDDNKMGDDNSNLNADDNTEEITDVAYSFNVKSSADFIIDENGIIRIVEKTQELKQEPLNSQPSSSNEILIPREKKVTKKPTNSYQEKLQKLRNRKLKSLNTETIEESFGSIPDIYNQQVVTVNVPDEKLLPRNVYLNNSVYVLNIEHIRTKSTSPWSSCHSDVPSNVRRIGSPIEIEPQNTAAQFNFRRYQTFHNPHQFRHSWRSQLDVGYYPSFQHFFPRPHLPSFYAHRFRFHQFHSFTQQDPNFESHRQNHFEYQRRRRNSQIKFHHLQAIKNLAARVQRLSQMFRGIDTSGLYRLLAGYNSKYNERLRLTRDFEVINVNAPTEVIELDDDEESSSKKPLLEENNFDKHLKAIKVLTGKLKELVDNNQCSSRHRRAISNLIKKFNKSFNADIYMDPEYNIIDRKFITLDSSSENESNKKKTKRKKKLRNPFNILKQMSAKANCEETVANEDDTETPQQIIENPRETLLKYFKKEWLPSNDDFGRPEVCTKHFAKTHIAETQQDQCLFDFLQDRPNACKNWLDLKMSFVTHLEASSLAHENKKIDLLSKDFMMDLDSKVKPIIGLEDCKDMPTVLEKLRIIRTQINTHNDTSLRIHFDVYNRDVQNYSKKEPPTPHFRIICVEESSEFPTGSDIASLHSRYDDKVPIVFAIVGLGSISYLRMNPYDLDVYIPTD